jgi:hypothetical protein
LCLMYRVDISLSGVVVALNPPAYPLLAC